LEISTAGYPGKPQRQIARVRKKGKESPDAYTPGLGWCPTVISRFRSLSPFSDDRMSRLVAAAESEVIGSAAEARLASRLMAKFRFCATESHAFQGGFIGTLNPTFDARQFLPAALAPHELHQSCIHDFLIAPVRISFGVQVEVHEFMSDRVSLNRPSAPERQIRVLKTHDTENRPLCDSVDLNIALDSAAEFLIADHACDDRPFLKAKLALPERNASVQAAFRQQPRHG
jgi:hypothetical protein